MSPVQPQSHAFQQQQKQCQSPCGPEQVLLQALAGCLDADGERRRHAEAFVRQAEQQAGYAVALVSVALGKGRVDIGTRQLAAVLVKKLINERWSKLDLVEMEMGDSGFIVPDEDKVAVRRALVSGLGDEEHCIRVAVGVAIAAVAYRDWPEQWPELTGILVDAVKSRANSCLVQGALGCLEIMADDIDENTVPQMVQELMPVLPDLCMSGELNTRGHAFAVVCGILAALGLLTGEHQEQVIGIIAPTMPSWIDIFKHTLGAPCPPVPSADAAGDLKAKTEVLRCSIQFILYFGKTLQPHAVSLFSSCLDVFSRMVPVYVDSVVNAECGGNLQGNGTEGNWLTHDGNEIVLSRVAHGSDRGCVSCDAQSPSPPSIRARCQSAVGSVFPAQFPRISFPVPAGSRCTSIVLQQKLSRDVHCLSPINWRTCDSARACL